MPSATTTAVAADNLSRRTTLLFAVTAGSAEAYRRAGWSGTCALLAALAAAALARHISRIATRAGRSARTRRHTPQAQGRKS